jgi:rhodanese-related sulfurtransferase
MLNRVNLSRLLQFGLNAIVICFAGWVASVFYFLFAGSRPAEGIPPLTMGSRFVVSEMPQSPKVLAIATSPICRFSRENEQFHARLLEAAQLGGVETLLLTPRGLPLGFTRPLVDSATIATSIDFAALGIVRTPTVIFLDRGAVVGMWVGRMDPQFQAAMIARVRDDRHILSSSKERLGSADHLIEIRSDMSDYRIIDVREREDFDSGHLAGARNLPLSELWLRAPIEMTATGKPLIVDCGRSSPSTCRAAADILSSEGLGEAMFLDIGAYAASCSSSSSVR